MAGERVAELKYLEPSLAVAAFPERHRLHRRTIRDGRALPELGPERPLLDALNTFGFGLQRVPHSPLGLAELRDPARLDAEYTPRLLEWIKAETGAAFAMKVNAVLRRSLGATVDRDAQSTGHFVPKKQGDFTGAIDGVHADFADSAAVLEVARSVQVDRGLHGGRWIAVNCWRPITEEAVACWPLAVCDGRTVAPAHLAPRETPQYNNVVLNARPEGDHQWCARRRLALSLKASRHLTKCRRSGTGSRRCRARRW